MTKEEWDEKRRECPYFYNTENCGAGMRRGPWNICNYQFCPFVFWLKAKGE